MEKNQFPPGISPEILLLRKDQDQAYEEFLKLPMPDSPPLSTFEGYLKQLHIGEIDNKLQRIFYLLFPGFMQSMTEPVINESINRTLEDLDFANPDYVRRRRRYSPPLGLPGGRYYTLSHNPTGDDSKTLIYEMLAYVDPIQGGVVFDLIDGFGGMGFKGEVADLEQSITFRIRLSLQLCKLLNPAILNLWEDIAAQKLPELTTFIISLPYTVKQSTIPNILDLRQKIAQEWLLEGFAKKENAFLKKAERKDISKFIEILPTLMDVRLGGNIVTDSLACFLSFIGASGLIFPSARINSSVLFKDSTVIDWKGWNFVDYRNIDPSIQTILDFTKGWRKDLRKDAEIQYEREGDHIGSWATKGLSEYTMEAANWAMTLFSKGVNYNELIAEARAKNEKGG